MYNWKRWFKRKQNGRKWCLKICRCSICSRPLSSGLSSCLRSFGMFWFVLSHYSSCSLDSVSTPVQLSNCFYLLTSFCNVYWYWFVSFFTKICYFTYHTCFVFTALFFHLFYFTVYVFTYFLSLLFLFAHCSLTGSVCFKYFVLLFVHFHFHYLGFVLLLFSHYLYCVIGFFSCAVIFDLFVLFSKVPAPLWMCVFVSSIRQHLEGLEF